MKNKVTLLYIKSICASYLCDAENADTLPDELLIECSEFLSELFNSLSPMECDTLDMIAIYHGIINKILDER